MESQIHGHPIVDHHFRPHSRKLGYPPFLDKAMWVKNLRLMEPHGICGRKSVGNFERVEKNTLFRIWKNDKEWRMTSISRSFDAEDMWDLDSFEPHQLASTFPSPGGWRASTPRACQTRALRPTAIAPSYRGATHRWWEIGVSFRGQCDGMMDLDGIWQFSWESWQPWCGFDGFWDPQFWDNPFFGRLMKDND